MAEQYLLDLDDEEETPDDKQEEQRSQLQDDDEYSSFEDLHFSRAQGG